MRSNGSPLTSLAAVVEQLTAFDNDDTIYASEPWTERSAAIVAREPEAGGLPPEAAGAGLKYFLEVSVAAEFIEGWIASLSYEPSLSSVCQRLIQYAIHDA
jgi:hypothetical protein